MRVAVAIALVVAMSHWSSGAHGGNAVRKGALIGFFCNVTTGNENVTISGQAMVAEGDLVECPEAVTCPDGETAVEGSLSGGSGSVFVNGKAAAISGESAVADACIQLDNVSGWPFVEVGQ